MRANAFVPIIAGCALILGLGATDTAAQERTMRLHTLVQSPHPYNDMAEFMAAEIAERSGGAIAIEVFPGASLGNDPAVIGEMALGTIDLMVSSTNNAEGVVPELAIFSMPYLFDGLDGLMEKVGPGTDADSYFRQVFMDSGAGLHLLALGGSGTRNLSTSTGPVETVEDIRGVKMRVPPSPMISKTWAALGTVPVQVAWAELYAAIQTGVADALESSIPGYVGSKLYEVAPNLALTAHTIQANHISMARPTWDSLTGDEQAMFMTVAAEAAALGADKAGQYEDEFVASLQAENDVTVTRPDIAGFQEVLAAELDLAEQLAVIRGTN